jgi:ADP-heptose:LPS heptosyltransferase
VEPLRPPLPADYVAVRFYFSECFPATPENQQFARNVVASLAERTTVVVLNPGFAVDEHTDWTPDARGRVVSIGDGLTPERNLAVQSAAIAGARAFVGTYGGYSYLAPLYKVPAVAFYSRQSFKLHHLHAAQRAFSQIGAAALMPLDVAQASLVQAAIGALVAA